MPEEPLQNYNDSEADWTFREAPCKHSQIF